MSDNAKAYFSPMPKMSVANTKRKTIKYLQQCKDEGKKIVQHCPSMLSPIFSMAALMADVDIARLPPSAIQMSNDEVLQQAASYIQSYHAMAPTLHLNYRIPREGARLSRAFPHMLRPGNTYF